jgi:hypothetical protein
MLRTVFVTVGVALFVVGGSAPLAAAAPVQETVPLVCDNGDTFDVAVNGNGEFTPGRIVGDTAVLVPTSFGEFHFTAVLPDGTVAFDETEPGTTKGGGNVEARSPLGLVTCSFEESETLTEDDPESGLPAGTVLTFSSTVTGFIAGH